MRAFAWEGLLATNRDSGFLGYTSIEPNGGTDIVGVLLYLETSVKKYLCALALAVAIAGLGQAATGANTAASKNASMSAAPQRRLSDAQIEQTIRAKFAKSKIASKEHFTVRVQNGVATLEGKTNVIQHKGTATRMAKTAGAVSVQNNIQISDEAKARAAARLARYRGATTEPVRATVMQPR